MPNVHGAGGGGEGHLAVGGRCSRMVRGVDKWPGGLQLKGFLVTFSLI